MVGSKGRSFSSKEDEAVYQTQTDNENYANSTQQNTQGIGSGVFDDQSGYANISQSGRDQRNASLDGSLFRGNIGFLLQSAFIDSTTNILNLLVDQNNDPIGKEVSTDRIPIISGLGTTVNLITIIGAERPGQRLAIYGILGNTITLIHNSSGTENTILCPNNVNFTLIDTQVVELFYDSITTQWRVVGISSSGGGGAVTFPILYPKENLNPSIDATATIDLAIDTGNAKQIQFPAGDISFEISGDPANTVGQDVYVLFIQDSIGGRSLTSVDSRLKDGGLMDTLLDKAANAKTLFRISTLDGGLVYHPMLIDLANSTSTFLSTLAIDVDKDWAGRFITNLAGIDLFANSVANSITNANIISFISDGAVPRGQIGRSDFFGTSQGTTINIPGSTSNFVVSEDGTEAFKINFTTNDLTTFNLDMNIENTDSFKNPALTLFNDVNGADEQTISNVIFKGKTTTGGDFTYGAIETIIKDETPGQEKSTIILKTVNGGIFGDSSLAVNTAGTLFGDRVLLYETNFDITTLTPSFEISNLYTNSPPTGVKDIGVIVFSSNTNDSSSIGPQELFASIIGTLEDPDINNESGSLRLRVRDKTGFAGSIKTYLQLNDTSSGIIQALKDVTLENFTNNPVLTLFRNQTGVADNLLGKILFKGENNIGDTDIDYGEITSTIEDPSSFSANIKFRVRDKAATSGEFKTYLQFNESNSESIEALKPLNMKSNVINTVQHIEFDNTAEFTAAGSAIGFDFSESSMIYDTPLTASIHKFKINNELMASIFRSGVNSGTLQVDNVIANLLQGNELIDLSTFTNSSPSNGNIWLDLSSGLFQFRQNDVTVGLGGGGVAFPIRPPVTTSLPTTGTVTLDLNQTSGHYFDIGTLTGNIDISITNPPSSGTAQAFRINIVKGATDFTVTFNDTLLVTPIIGSANTTTLLAGDIYDGSTFNIFTMTSTAGSGGGGVSFPIIPPVGVRGTVTTTQNIDLSLSISHSTTMTLGASISITFSNFPITGNQIEWEIQITQDSTGGRIVTWPAEVTNPPVLDTTADSISVVSLRTNDGGTTVRVGNTVTTTGSGNVSQWATFTAVQDIDYGTFDGINIDRLLFDKAAGEVLAATDTGITSDATGNLNFNSLDEYDFAIDGTSALAIDDDGTGTLRLDMKLHSIINTKDIKFDLNATFNLGNTEAGIGTSGGAIDELIYNVPSTWEQKWKINGVNKVTLNASSLSLESGFRLILQPSGTNAGLRLGAVSGNPSTLAASDMWFDSTANQFKARDNSGVVVLGGDINTLAQGNSSVTVTDPGTGLIQFTADNTLVAQMQNNRMDFQDTPVFGMISLFFTDTVDEDVGTTLTQNQNDFTMNFPANSDDFVITFNTAEGLRVDKDITRISSTSPNTVQPVFKFLRDDGAPGGTAAHNKIGVFEFLGKNNATPTAQTITYAEFSSEIVSAVDDDEIGRLRWTLIDKSISVNSMTLSPGNLTVREFKTAPIATGKAIFHLLKEDASPANSDSIGAIDFDILDSDVTTNYARILGKIAKPTDAGSIQFNVRADDVSDVNVFTIEGSSTAANRTFVTFNSNARIASDLKFQSVTGSTDLKIFPALNQLGIVVQDNTSYTVGNKGSIALPFTNSEPTSDLDADLQFGTHQGQIGISRQSAITTAHKLWSRADNGKWGFTNVVNAF